MTSLGGSPEPAAPIAPPLPWWRDSPLLAILAAGLVVRLLLLLAASGIDVEVGDEPFYHQIASNLLHRNEFALAGKLTSWRPPLYPFLVSCVWRVTGESFQAMRAVQVVLSLLTVVVVHRLGDLVSGRRVALLAAAGVCFYPSLLFLNLLLMTETLFTLLLVLAVHRYLVMLRSSSSADALLSGVLFALGALTRSMLLPFSLLLVPLTLLIAPGRLAGRARVAALLLAAVVATLAPWSIRNTRLNGVFTMVDTASGFQLRLGNWEGVDMDRMWEAGPVIELAWRREAISEFEGAADWTEGRCDRWLRQKAIRYVIEHPAETAHRDVVKFANLWGLDRLFPGAVQRGLYHPPPWLTAAGTAALTLAFPAALLLGCLGVFLAPPRDRRDHLVFLLVIAHTCAVHTLAFGHSRYNVPLMPFVMIYAASALADRSWTRLREGPRVAAPPVLAMLLFTSIWVHEVAFADSGRIRRLLDSLGW